MAAQKFILVERKAVGKKAFYLRKIVEGVELYNNSIHRLDIVSENQNNYPVPQSGCGPTAMLSILMWYENYGIIKSFHRDKDLREYKLSLFREIDNHLLWQAGVNRTENSGVNILDIAVVMDYMFKSRSKDGLRIHTEVKNEPLKTEDFLRTMRYFRSGILIGMPKDPETGELASPHAMVVMEADKGGCITLGTWGQHYHGFLRARADGQWFIPLNSSQLELKVSRLIRFIPFQLKTKI